MLLLFLTVVVVVVVVVHGYVFISKLFVLTTSKLMKGLSC